MLTGIDHLVIACGDPHAAAMELEGLLGLRATGGGSHQALGTFNRLIWLGDSYLELIGVTDRALAEASWIGAPTVRALDAGGGLATWAARTDSIAATLAVLRGRGSDLGDPIPGERARPDGRVVRWAVAVPARLGPAEPPFLIEHDPTAAEWTPDERAHRATEVHPIGGPVRLDVLELPVADPARTGAALLRRAGIGPVRPSLAGRGARDAAIGSQTVRLRPDERRGPGSAWSPATIHLRVVSGGPETARAAELLGCRWVTRPA